MRKKMNVLLAMIMICALPLCAAEEIPETIRPSVWNGVGTFVTGIIKTVFSITDGLVKIGHYKSDKRELTLLTIDTRDEKEIIAAKEPVADGE